MRRAMLALAVLALTAGCTTDPQVDATPTPGEPTPSPTPEVTPDPATDPEAFVEVFMRNRLDGDAEAAESVLGPQAKRQYDETDGGLRLVAEDDPTFDRWELLSLEAIDASSLEAQVRVYETYEDAGETSSFVEVLFVGSGPDHTGETQPLVVRGALRRDDG